MAARSPVGPPQPERGRLPSEREILRVLWASMGEYLVRSEIHRLMRQEHQPTLGRVGQILSELAHEGYLVRAHRRAQGNRNASFYQLSKNGVELCHRLGFRREEDLLFPITKDLLERALTRSRLSFWPDRPGRVTAVYGHRSRLGRTTMVAHVARNLAESYDPKMRVIVIDLNFDLPDLDPFFAPKGLEKCCGLGGLVIDFHRKPLQKRHLWLRGALSDSRYVYMPFPEIPNLFYLPSGLSSGQTGLSPEERLDAQTLLGVQSEKAQSKNLLSPKGSHGFLSALRQALCATFTKTLLDTQVGHSLSNWIATQVLGDEVIIFIQKEDTNPATLTGIKAVLANFLTRWEGGEERNVSTTFVFPVGNHVAIADLNNWIERHIIAERDDDSERASYNIELLPWEPRISKRPFAWRKTKRYDSIVARIKGIPIESSVLPSPGLKLIVDVLEPNTPWKRRHIAAGTLANTSLQELGRLLEWFEGELQLHRPTDRIGEEFIKDILKAQERRMRSMFQPPTIHRLENKIDGL